MTDTQAIPLEALKQSLAIVGRTGAGKSFAARGAIEQLLRAGERVCIIDPTSVHWGLRSSPDGKSAGFPVVIFGGEHADVPFDFSNASAHALAQLIAGSNIPTIVDVADMSMGARTRFMTAFLDSLYRANKLPLTLLVDEADLFAPQRAMPDQTHMLNRMEQIVRRGRVKGFRPWLITQRPAELHKSVLSQANTLIAMQLTAPQDRNAIGDWIEGQADRDEGKRVLAALPKLAKGEGFVWAPALDILAQFRFPPITTFDSGKTPEPGDEARQLKLADVDIGAIRAQFASAAEEAADSDVPTLRARIAELERQVERRDAAPDVGALERWKAEGVAMARREAFVALRGPLLRLDAAVADLRTCVDAIDGPAAGEVVDTEGQSVTSFEATKAAALAAFDVGFAHGFGEVAEVVVPKPAADAVGKARTNGAAGGLDRAARALLTAAAQRVPHASSRAQLSILSGYSAKSSSFANALGRLRTLGYLQGTGDHLLPTAAGLKIAGWVEPMPSGRQRVAYWGAKLGKPERSMLYAIADASPKALTKEQLGKLTGYSVTSSSFANALGKLRGLGLVDRGDIRAARALIE